jgi:hypothetical protein
MVVDDGRRFSLSSSDIADAGGHRKEKHNGRQYQLRKPNCHEACPSMSAPNPIGPVASAMRAMFD